MKDKQQGLPQYGDERCACGEPATVKTPVYMIRLTDHDPQRYQCLKCAIAEADEISESLAFEMSRS